MKAFDIPFEETCVTLRQETTKAEILKFSPSGFVPALMTDEMTVTDSLAIAEYLADRFPEKHLWPEDRLARAMGRMMSAEMHSGFKALREEMPMDFTQTFDPAPPSPAVQTDIDRIISLWTEARETFGDQGPWLLGDLSIADAMFAPVVSRFRSYGVQLPDALRSYADQVWQHPAMQDWYQGSLSEG